MLERTRESLAIAVTTDPATTGTILMGRYATFLVHVPSGESITTLTIYGYNSVNDTYSPLSKVDGTAAEMAVTDDGCYETPIAVYACERVRLVGNVAGNVVVTLVT